MDRCRLCLTSLLAIVDTEDSSRCIVNLFDPNDRPHLVVDKLRQFVNLNIHPQDNCSKKVCRNCVMNLDFCIQYVDRCRRVNELVHQVVMDSSKKLCSSYIVITCVNRMRFIIL